MNPQFLENFKILPTDQRMQVLNLIMARNGDSFSAEDIVTQSLETASPLHKSMVNKVLRLYNVRGILKMVDMRKTSRRGRPECVFQIIPGLISKRVEEK